MVKTHRAVLMGPCLGALALAGLANPMRANAAIQVWVESSGVMIMPDRTPPEGAGREIRRSGVRNEYVTAQIAVRATEPVSQPLAFQWSDLAGPAGTIGKNNITLFRAAEIVVEHSREQVSPTDPLRARRHGLYPDALVPLMLEDETNVANSILPDKDRTLSFWVDIWIPGAARPGAYEGTITLKNPAGVHADVRVKLTVLNAEIPAEPSMPSVFNLRFHRHVRPNAENYVAEVRKHRLQPTNTHWFDTYMKQEGGLDLVDKLNPGGRGFVSLYLGDTQAPDEKRKTELLADLKMAEDHLRTRGLLDRTFIYLKDEPTPREVQGVAEFARFLVDAAPQWKGKLLCTLNREGTDLDTLVTYHVRALKSFMRARELRETWLSRGQQLWFYVSNAQGTPYPTFDVHAQNLAWEPRVLGWAYWFEHAQGHLYWDLMCRNEWVLLKGFPPGDGQLMYPGDFTLPGAPPWTLVKDIRRPVVSRRMKIHREGLEEWEMLRLAEKKVGREKVEPIVARNYRFLGLTPWSKPPYNPNDPPWSYREEDWDAAREAVLKILIEP